MLIFCNNIFFILFSFFFFHIFYDLDLNNEYIDIGDCNCICQYCGVLFWKYEQIRNTNPPKYLLCCQNGKVSIPLTKKSPTILTQLLDYYGGSLSSNFRKNIRTYNSMFAFTSFEVNIQSDINKLSRPYIFKISGQIHYLIVPFFFIFVLIFFFK